MMEGGNLSRIAGQTGYSFIGVQIICMFLEIYSSTICT